MVTRPKSDKYDPDCARRPDQRASLGLWCEARQGLGEWRRVRLKDLSASGFRIAGFPNADPGQNLRIRIPGLELLTAKVRWQQGRELGCEFAAPLHQAVFDHMVQRMDAA